MTKRLDHQALADFTRRWFALWTEADPHARSSRSPTCGRPAGAQVLVDPPQAMRDAVTELAFPVPPLEVRGHDEIDRRVTRAYYLFIQPGEYTFASGGGDAVLLAPALSGWGGTWSRSRTGPSLGADTTCSSSMTTAASCWTTSTSWAEARSSFSATPRTGQRRPDPD